jgi:uncharacterized membrane protein
MDNNSKVDQDNDREHDEEKEELSENDQQKNDLPQQIDPQQKRRLIAARRESIFIGPLPAPEILEQYNNILPGCAETIPQQFVEQGQHRRELEKLVVSSDVARANWGLILGFILGLVGLIGSFYVISIGYSLVGLAAIIAALGTLVGSFIYVTRKRDQERQEKEKSVSE